MRKKKQTADNKISESVLDTDKNHLEKVLGSIELSNLVPFDAELKPFDVFERWMDFMPELHDRPDEFYAKWLTQLKSFPKLVDYILSEVSREVSKTEALYEKHGVSEPLSPEYGRSHAFYTFHQFVKTREFVKLLVEISEKYRNDLKIEERISKRDSELGIEPIFPPWSSQFRISSKSADSSARTAFLKPLDPERFGERLFEVAVKHINLRTDVSHQIKIEFSGFLEWLPGLDLRRFKKCLVCKKIFWAFRLNTDFCSTKCLNIYHQRRYQSDPEKRLAYNKRRRENYARRKNLEEIRSNKDGIV
ncbi:MAG TPA: hypothetical protein VF644_03070 [Pyrinomonadaceae bacterium]|jgi:hypothetical protein